MRIRISAWESIEPGLRFGFRHSRHQISFGEVPPGGGDFDLVVPVSIPSLLVAAKDEELRRRNPIPIPTVEAITLFDDKAALNERLRACGFGAFVPREIVAGIYPYMLKRRWDSSASNAYRIDGPADEATHQEKIESPAYIRQDWLPGDTEYTEHLLQIGGSVRRSLSFSFRMQHSAAIRGRESPLFHHRCRSRLRYTRLFESMLKAVGFEGLCCVNYKLRDGNPVVMEINPRFGFSLAPFFPSFLRGLDWSQRVGLL